MKRAMREVTVEFLREEMFRSNTVLTQTRVLHGCGMRIHGSADSLTGLHLKAMTDSGIRSVFLVEPGESEAACARAMAVEKVTPREVVVGDIFMDDMKAPDGTVWAAAGTIVDAPELARLPEHAGEVAIRRRALDTDAAQARQYLGRAPLQPPRAAPPGGDGTKVTRVQLVKDLLVPRSKVFVCIRAEDVRLFVAQTLKAEGHEVQELPDTKALALAILARPDLVVLGLDDVQAACEVVRQSTATRSTGILVAAPEGQAREVYKALTAGANGSFSLPAARETLLEAVNGILRVMGKFVRMKPAVRGERRGMPRESVQFVGRLTDAFLAKPLVVENATVEDTHEKGLRIVYQRPTWPIPWAYMPGSVHPKHYFFNYAKVNPLGREVTLSFVSPGGAGMQVQAHFVHIRLDGAYESAGLLLRLTKGTVKKHMTTMRERGL
jgi:DNA-binding response OmpR family regulator